MKYKRLTNKEEIHQGIDLWNSYFSSFDIEHRLVEQNIFAPYAGVNVVGWGGYRDDKLVAFGLVKYLSHPVEDYTDGSLGWISLLVLDEDAGYWNQTFQNMMDRMEKELTDRGVTKIRFGGDPQNFLPGLPQEMKDMYLGSFKSRDYREKGVVYDLYRDISDFKIHQRVRELKDEYQTDLKARPVVKDEEEVLLQFLANNFSGRWLYEADNIRRVPGGIEDYWLLWLKDKPIGFVRINRVDSTYLGPNVNWGRRWGKFYCGLGPLGIDKSYRGQSFGLYLQSMVIDYLREEGYQHMIIDWTTLLDYYKKLGFAPCNKYNNLIKEID